MKTLLSTILMSLALVASPLIWAQSTTGVDVPEPSAAKSKSAKKKKPRKASHKAEAEPVAAPAAVAAATPGMPVLSEPQLELAQKVQTGDIACDDKLRVKVVPMPDAPGYFHVQLGVKDRFEMVPVATQTGAVRLEDPARGGVWIQLPAKSMLMNTKLGQRMADACRTPQQQAVEAAAQHTPPPNLLEPQTEVVQR
ncbi:MAG: hypothetical protein EBV20_06865 [Betaproteobacteria bacterium]|jgi:hypothetical protein|nr:hypothetical protein [Betaproteobacteria bacterium]NBP45351.1 hypothetical protein [Betaproteobacteria bacterium]